MRRVPMSKLHASRGWCFASEVKARGSPVCSPNSFEPVKARSRRVRAASLLISEAADERQCALYGFAKFAVINGLSSRVRVLAMMIAAGICV